MNKSVSTQLLEYLQANPGIHSSGDLQRTVWYNKDRTEALPRTVVRRLQELAEDGKIQTDMIHGHAMYSSQPIIKPKIVIKIVDTPDGPRAIKTLV